MKDDTAPITGQAHQDTIHDSAIKHVTGRAEYTDDLVEPRARSMPIWACPPARMGASWGWISPTRWPSPASSAC